MLARSVRPSCQTWGVSDRRQRLAQAELYLVCDDRPDPFLRAALRGGVDIVQLRMKESPDEAILAAARRFRRVCAEDGTLLIVNDRPELAAAADADGVHLGQDDVPVAHARGVLGDDRLIGLSTHSPGQIDAAALAGVDYIGVGPVNETPTKPGRPAVGLELVRYAAGHTRMPFFAIGGISGSNVEATRDAGARRVAVVRALTEADDPQAAALELRRRLARRQEVTVGTT
jgi:thiamine-phosphate pyrophosphorylase